jgi:hypothetical protein
MGAGGPATNGENAVFRPPYVCRRVNGFTFLLAPAATLN